MTCQVLKAQQRENFYSQYYQNPQILNPAFSGIDNFWSVDVGYRRSMTGIDNPPNNYFLGLNGILPISHNTNEPYNSLWLSNDKVIDQYESNLPIMGGVSRHGLGGFVYKREAGMYDHTVGGISYAYYVPLTRQWMLSSGVGFYLDHQRFDIDNLRIREVDDIRYLRLLNEEGKSTTYDLHVGLALHSRNVYFGYTFSQYFGTSVTDDQLDVLVGYRGHLIDLGYKYRLNVFWSLMASVHYKILNSDKDAYLVSLRADYKNLLNFGFAYKDKEAVAGMIGFNIKNKVHISYSYDLPTPEMETMSDGSHEIVLGYNLFAGSGKKYFW